MATACRPSQFHHLAQQTFRDIQRNFRDMQRLEVEHHLWPAMSFVQLQEASRIVKTTCAELRSCVRPTHLFHSAYGEDEVSSFLGLGCHTRRLATSKPFTRRGVPLSLVLAGLWFATRVHSAS